MAHRSQSSSVGENPLDPNYLPPHYREEYRLAIDALVKDDMEGYHHFLQGNGVMDFLARPEIQHIKETIQTPHQAPDGMLELTYHDPVEPDGSSDTYWPLHSDHDAPGLDLGWPQQQHSFIGPTEVTILVNPSDPDMPSIKVQARRLIKTAQFVIAVAMDMFTDVDIFADLLDAAARHVPVYILLDEKNAHHFVTMVNNCKVNLDMIHMLRVRTVAGVTYFCRTGQSFKGQMMDRFLLVDCRAVLSGNYSFMWSFEKIHRCIAHLFLGELVTTFDEEFRILFAQSQPLTVENALVPAPSDGGGSYYGSNQFGINRTQSLRSTRGLGLGQRHPEFSAYPYGDGDRNVLPFRRDDSYRHSMEPVHSGVQIGKYASQQFRLQQSFLEQGRSMMASRQMEANAYKRHSYTEGTQESYSSSRLYMKNRVMNNLDEVDLHYQRDQAHFYQEESGSGHNRYDTLRSRGQNQMDQYSDTGYQHELEPPGGINRDYMSNEDLTRHEPGYLQTPGGVYYSSGGQKRPTMGQAYACQSSPTQQHPPDQKQLFSGAQWERQPQDPDAKQGLRSWRINSYLNTYEEGAEEGLPQPMGPDAFEEPLQPDSRIYGQEQVALHFASREPPVIPPKPKMEVRLRYGKPMMPDTGKELGLAADREEPGGDAADVNLTRHDSFRTRMNPLLQRSSRLRSSLIFSSSKLEQHSSQVLKSGEEIAEEEDKDQLRTSSIVAEILEKRRSITREPFEWRSKKADEKETTEAKEDPVKVSLSSSLPQNPTLEDMTKVPEAVDSPKPEVKSSTNMNDPASRLMYFQELAAKRKASKIEIESTVRNPEPAVKKPDLLEKPLPPAVAITTPEPAPKEPEVSTMAKEFTPKASLLPVQTDLDKQGSIATGLKQESPETAKKEFSASKILKPLSSPKFFKRDHSLKPFKSSSHLPRRISCDEDLLKADATDAEKSELKKSRSHSSSSTPKADFGEKLHKSHGSNTSLNLTGEGKQENKPLDFLKKQTQRLKGFLGPKDKKLAGAAEEKNMSTVPEIAEEATPRARIGSHSSGEAKLSPSRYQTSTANVIFSSNLRDDTKVILEQISANSQKNRLELAKQAEEVKDGKREDAGGGGSRTTVEKEPSSFLYQNRNRFQRPQANPQERDTLLKRIESMRKDKKVYSRFEMGNNLG